MSSEQEVLVFDTEANHLLHKVTKVWCVVLINAETEVIEVYHDYPQYNGAEVFDKHDNKTYVIPVRNGSLTDGIKRLHKAGNSGAKLVAHNVLGYDDALMRKFFPKYDVPIACYHDTLIQSKIQFFDRVQPKGAKGTHGLQAWGIRAGVMKPEIQDWSTMDAFKLHRCIEDVKINLWTYKFLEQERNNALERLSIDFTEALDLEHKYRYYKTQQELRGAAVDIEHMKRCIEDLDDKTETLRVEIEPLLPPTLKVKAPKCGSTEVTTALGFKNPAPDTFENIMRSGEVIKRMVKKWYRPVVNFTKSVKTNKYQAVLEDKETGEVLLSSPNMFEKLKEAREWSKTHDAPKGSKWKFPKEEVVTQLLNAHTCNWFGIEEDSDMVAGAHTRIDWVDSKLSQPAVVKRYLISLGWEPTEWNPKKDDSGQFLRASHDQVIYWPEKAAPENQISIEVRENEPLPSSPKLTEDSYESLPEGVGKKIAQYNTYKHRRTFLSNPTDTTKGLLNQVREDGRLPCGVNCFGTATGRASHYNWVNVAGEGALYGAECRKIIVAPNGRKLVGADMKSAQLSIAAYYANNWSYYDAIVNGQEVVKDKDGNEVYVGESGHCVNARAFGLVEEQEWHEAIRTQDKALLHSIMLRRKDSKACTFGTIFGCSGKKLAKMAKVSPRRGAEMKKKFLSDLGLDVPIARCEKMLKKNKRGAGGYIELPMGYYAFCKQAHKLFNYLDQGTEAVMQKVAVVWFEEQLAKKGLDAFTVLDYHDEFLTEASDEHAEEVGQLMCDAYKYASDACLEWHLANSKWFRDLTFAFNLDGGYKVGVNYLETH